MSAAQQTQPATSGTARKPYVKSTNPYAAPAIAKNNNWSANGGEGGRARFYGGMMNKGPINYYGYTSPNRTNTGLENATIDTLLASWNPPACQNDPNVNQNAIDFLNLVRDSQLNFDDLYSVMRTVKNSVNAKLGAKVVKVPGKGTNRGAGLSVVPVTGPRYNKKGQLIASENRKVNDNPSFLWALITENCAILKELTAELYNTLTAAGVDLVNGRNYVAYQMQNSAYANSGVADLWPEIVRRNPQCANVDKGYLNRFLDDIDATKINAADLNTFIRTYTVQYGGPIYNAGSTRADRAPGNGAFSVSQFTSPRPGTKLANSKRNDKLKASIIFHLADNYCENFPALVTDFETYYNIPPSPTGPAVNLTQYAKPAAARKALKPASAPAPQAQPSFAQTQPAPAQAQSAPAPAPATAQAQPSFAQAQPSFAQSRPTFGQPRPSFAFQGTQPPQASQYAQSARPQGNGFAPFQNLPGNTTGGSLGRQFGQ